MGWKRTAVVATLAATPVSPFSFSPSLPHTCSCYTSSRIVAQASPFAAPWALRSTSEVIDTAAAGELAEIATPQELASACGIDYVPLATMLATGDFKGADQFTRDALIRAAGEASRKRNFVYFTDVKDIPATDLRTIERLWLKHSKGKFGYSVQREAWQRTKGDFESFCRRVGWNTKDKEVERKLRWFGANEFIYDVDKAPKGHLPLTSALRGTTLLRSLFTHPLWETEWQKEG